ncbi:hypothetical protein NDU88_007765 [Pleurodeles waltl]|uniref:Response regulatory domain-containing protein n=1 Tax=Pleurodeles waltl TaxID=8319 RepID=A0AAV7NU33_PLEWA|nr:hypothetical protein NDU88_007765 [Pleurodeles waltl]
MGPQCSSETNQELQRSLRAAAHIPLQGSGGSVSTFGTAVAMAAGAEDVAIKPGRETTLQQVVDRVAQAPRCKGRGRQREVSLRPKSKPVGRTA